MDWLWLSLLPPTHWIAVTLIRPTRNCGLFDWLPNGKILFGQKLTTNTTFQQQPNTFRNCFRPTLWSIEKVFLKFPFRGLCEVLCHSILFLDWNPILRTFYLNFRMTFSLGSPCYYVASVLRKLGNNQFCSISRLFLL